MKLYTMDEVCAILRMSQPTVRNLIKSGKLKKLNTDGAIRISSDQLEKFLKGDINERNN